jgi:fibronectin type 3 domain-containing protein
MFNETRKFKQLILFFLIQVSAWAIMSLTGCGGGGNIPPASVLSSGRVTLSWDPIPGAASYNVYLATSPGVTTLNSFKISNASNPITITDLEPGTTYYFVVAVEDDSGASRQSKEVAYTVTDAAGSIEIGDILSQSKPEETSVASEAAPSETAAATKPKAKTEAAEEMPAAPTPAAKSSEKHDTKLRPIKSANSPEPEKSRPAKAGNRETQDVTLAWDSVPNATSYNIYWSDKPGVTRQNGTKISNVKNPYKMKGLKKGEKYYFVVTAVNASGESRESAEFSFTVGQ